MGPVVKHSATCLMTSMSGGMRSALVEFELRGLGIDTHLACRNDVLGHGDVRARRLRLLRTAEWRRDRGLRLRRGDAYRRRHVRCGLNTAALTTHVKPALQPAVDEAALGRRRDSAVLEREDGQIRTDHGSESDVLRDTDVVANFCGDGLEAVTEHRTGSGQIRRIVLPEETIARADSQPGISAADRHEVVRGTQVEGGPSRAGVELAPERLVLALDAD